MPSVEEERGRMWLDFTASLRYLSSMREIKLPMCPGSVIQSIAEALPDLEVLHAQNITDTIDPEKIR